MTLARSRQAGQGGACRSLFASEWTQKAFGVRLVGLADRRGSAVATSLVLTLIGPDRPGLVEDLSHAVAAYEGSWQSSRMARLGGAFAGILEVQVPDQRAAELSEALRGLEVRGLRVVVEAGAGAPAGEDYRELRLELVGQDRPGIMREISSTLAASGVNVVELSSRTRPAPMSGETLFSASALLHQSTSESVTQLRESLEKLASDLMVEISIAAP